MHCKTLTAPIMEKSGNFKLKALSDRSSEILQRRLNHATNPMYDSCILYQSNENVCNSLSVEQLLVHKHIPVLEYWLDPEIHFQFVEELKVENRELFKTEIINELHHCYE